MKRIVLRIVLVLVLLLVFVVGTLSLMRTLGSSRLERYKRELRAKGEKLLVSELYPGPVISNSLIPRLAIANHKLPPLTPMIDLMSGKPAWQKTNDWRSLHKLLDEAAPVLADIREGLKLQPRDLGLDYTTWNSYPSGTELIEVRRTALWLCEAIVIDLNRRNRVGAFTNLLSLLDLVRCHERDPNFVFQMVRVGLAGMAFEASWEAMQAGRWNDSELAALQQAWHSVALLPAVEFSLQMERARGLTFFQLSRADIGETRSPPDSFLEAMYGPVWKTALSSGDELRFLETMQTFLDGLRAAWQHSSGKHLPVVVPPNWLATYRYPLTKVAVPNIQKALNRLIRAEAQRQLVLAVIGLERYRLRHGRYPEKLEQLVPDILPSVLIDFGDGKPLRYEREEEHYRLWSVWENTRWPQAE